MAVEMHPEGFTLQMYEALKNQNAELKARLDSMTTDAIEFAKVNSEEGRAILKELAAGPRMSETKDTLAAKHASLHERAAKLFSK